MSDLSVLVIDDDRGDRKLIERFLRGCTENIQVHQALSASKALDDLADTPVDAIFLDQNMPGEQGVETLPRLRAHWPTTAIFLMRGQGTEHLAKTSIMAGANDYIAKSALSLNAVQRMLSNGVRAARENWKLEEQRRDLLMFSDVIVHDFKAPIRAARFLCEQISEDLEGGQIDEAREGLQLLGKSTDHMMQMIASLSDHIRLDRQETFDSYEVADLIEHALDANRLEALDRNAKISVQLDAALPKVHCVGPKIVQVLQNLIANAIKFTDTDQPAVKISVFPSETDDVVFEVQDNGIGIPIAYQEKIFEPFKRVPGRSSINGTGLGLATCKKNVSFHGGEIFCKSGVQGGAIFSFNL
jgi:signal transduction histidine kinase